MQNIQHRSIIFLIILVMTSLAQVMSDIYLPSLPHIAVSLKVSTHLVQLSLFGFMAGFAISQFFYGPLSDAFGRRWPTIIGVAICFIGSLFCLHAHSILAFNIGRAIQGLGAGAGMALSRTVMRDIYSGSELAKIGSYLSIIVVGIMTAAPFAGGYLQHWFGWRASFAVLSVYSIIILLLISFGLPETNQHKHRDHLKWQNVRTNIHSLVSHRDFRRYAFIIFVSYANILAWLTAGPIVLQNKDGMSPVSFGWFCLVIGAIIAFGNITNARLLKHYSPQKLTYMGSLVMVLGALLLFGFALLPQHNAWFICIPILIFMFSTAFTFGNSYASALTPFGKIVGMAAALTGFLQIFGGVMSSAVISIMPDQNAIPMGAVILLLSLMGLYLAKRK